MLYGKSGKWISMRKITLVAAKINSREFMFLGFPNQVSKSLLRKMVDKVPCMHICGKSTQDSVHVSGCFHTSAYPRVTSAYCWVFKHTSGSIASSQKIEECPYSSGSVYRVREGLEEFPDIQNIDYCSRLDYSHNRIRTLMNAHCLLCDFLSLTDNKCTELTAEMLSGFPNLKSIRLDNNSLYWIEGDALKGLKVLDVEHNPLQDIPWDHANKGLKVSLAGTTILCGCAMKQAIERGVGIETSPSCKGLPGIAYDEILNTLECSPVEQINRTSDPTTGTPYIL